MKVMTPIEQIQKNRASDYPLERALVIDINDILKRYDIPVDISYCDIRTTEKSVYDFFQQEIPIDAQPSANIFKDRSDETAATQDAELLANMYEDRLAQGANKEAKLSDAITNSLWPSITSASVYHYTSKENAEKILNTNIFRLYNIANDINEDGIITFCEAHGLKGYLENDVTGCPRYRRSIMQKSFYASFTDVSPTPKQEEHFRNYGPVRLKFEITASNQNFSKIYYEQTKGKPIPVLSELTNCIREKYNSRVFILKGISSLCFFYLSNQHSIENEYRLLHRVCGSSGPQPKNDGENSYIELPLDKMSKCGYQLKIVEVHATEKPDMPNSYLFSKRKA